VRPLAFEHETSLFGRHRFPLEPAFDAAPQAKLGVVDGYRAAPPSVSPREVAHADRAFRDDGVAILELVRRSLSKESYVVMTADSAAKALDILANAPVDIVVSDDQMPGMPGSKFLGRVSDAYPDIVLSC
jgi:hypothetical protein